MFDVHVFQETEENSTTSAALEMLINVSSTSFVPLAGHSMDGELEEDASFFDEIRRLFDSRKTSKLFPPRLLQHPRLLTLEIFANLPVYCLGGGVGGGGGGEGMRDLQLPESRS